MNAGTNVINMLIHHLTQITSVILAFVWFGWRGGLIIFLLNWSVNTVAYSQQRKDKA